MIPAIFFAARLVFVLGCDIMQAWKRWLTRVSLKYVQKLHWPHFQLPVGAVLIDVSED